MKTLPAKFFGVIALLLAFSNLARAGLQWDTTAASLETKPGDAFADAKFSFKNTGVEPVWITALDTSCSCLTPNQVIGEYKPGQGGVVTVRYRVGRRMGTLVETVTVHTSDRAAPTTGLNLTIYIPLTYRIEPNMITWSTGTPAEPHESYFYDLQGKGMKPVFVYSPSTNFTATLVAQPELHRYIIRVVPASTENEDATYISVDVDIGGGKIQKARILAAVRGAGSAQPVKISQ